MEYPDPHLAKIIRQPQATSYLVFFGFVVSGVFLSPFISYVVALVFTGFDSVAANALLVPTDLQDPLRTPMLVMQALSSLSLFLLMPYLYIRYFERGEPKILLALPQRRTLPTFFLVFSIVIAYMPLSAAMVNWNESIQFPPAFEQFARQLEDQLRKITEFLVNFQSPAQFVLGLIVVAVIPGIGEEYLFRGVLQNKLRVSSGNAHLAIWVSAFIFSAIHFQFYGFVPRMMLGALFGYLYLWSGTLWVPIFAHFVNNAYTLIWMYAYQKGFVQINVDATEEWGIGWMIGSSLLLSALLIIFIKAQKNIKNIV